MQVEVVTPKGQSFAGPADELIAPGQVGELGILPGHIPLLAGIRPGILRVRQGAQVSTFAVGSGFVQGGVGDRVVVLADLCRAPEDIDLDTARREYDADNAKLARWDHAIDAEYHQIEARRDWAQAQVLVVTGEYRNGGVGARTAPNVPQSPPDPAF
jgi:F-type H+-transporting ATPase subunit epsilon